MIKNIAIVSLSSGIVGESFVQHEVEIGLRRLKEYNINVKFMPNALKGLDYIKNNPDKRALDLINAFKDKEIDMILCAIGGEDTYRLLPYLFENDELKKVINNKIFLGFSDSTINHLMLHKLGLNTFYGQAFFSDICELENEMLPYSKKYFEELINTGTIKEIKPSDVWYEERKSFSKEEVRKDRIKHKNNGFKLIQGSSCFSGKILGGCIDTIYDIFDNKRFSDTIEVSKKYSLFPQLEDWKGKILLLESSEEQPTPAHYKEMLEKIKETGIFKVINGIILGKPMDELYYNEYNEIIKEVVNDKNLPIVSNINIGHATPRCIIPFGVEAIIDIDNQIIKFK